tara:strand:+ start:2569 stop:4059 length:1491 start_codon:yes stop_codon:yes gene_type:complete
MGKAPAKSEYGSGSSQRREGDMRQLSTLLETLPPHAIEAEMSLLGSILIDPNIIADVIQVVSDVNDFYKPTNGEIYAAMCSLYEEHSSLDIVQLHQQLMDRETLSAVGGLDYLVNMANAVPSAANATHYARLVKEKAVIRQLIEAAGEILCDAYGSPDESRDILENAERKIFRIAQQYETRQASSLQDLITVTMEQIEAREGKTITGVGCGFSELDRMTGGLQRGEMIILAARPSMGKTACALNIAEHVGLQGQGVAVFSLEMSGTQLVQRMLASRSRINGDRLRRNMLEPADFSALMAACDEMQDAPIHIDDTPGLNLVQLRAKARRLKQRHDIGMIVIDYLQLMSSGHRVENRQQEVSEISRGVKAMARELNVPVICLSQLNRAAEHREGHRPRMSDLRESGSIEQDADVILMLHREEYYHPDEEWKSANPDKLGQAEIIISKQRNGPTGIVNLQWDAATTRFHNYSYSAPPADMPATVVPPSSGVIDDDDLPI